MDEIISFTANVMKIVSTKTEWKHIAVIMDKELNYNGKVKNQYSSFQNKAGNIVYVEHIYGEYLPVIEGLNVTFTCKVNSKNGRTFLNCTSWTYAQPDTDKSVKAFLKSTLGKEKILSTHRINEMFKQYGNNCIEFLRSGNTSALFKFFCPKGASQDAMSNMDRACKLIQSNIDDNEFVASMSELGIKPTVTHKIIEKLGITTIEELKRNPYACVEVPGISFKQCDQIAIAIQANMETPERIVACTEAVLSSYLNRGSNLYADACTVRDETLKQLNNKNISKEMWSSAVLANLNSKKAKFFVYKNTIMLAKDADNELDACRQIRKIQENSKGKFDETRIRKIAVKFNEKGEKERGFKLTDEQVNAIVRSLTNKVSIITGGPGTGKTTITQMIIQIWKSLDSRPVTCMAPTGKAATRMSEQTGEKAQTIHKTVRIIPGEENEEELERVQSGLIIVDESSMIDMETMRKMIDCIPATSTLIFLGDIDQLPSVGKGDVLHQMIISNAIAVSKLTATKRQAEGSPIIENARRINTGVTDLLYDDKIFKFINAKDADVQLLSKLYLEKVKEYGISQVAILCPLRKPTRYNYQMVADNLNKLIRDAINPHEEEKNFIEVRQGTEKTVFREGDRVMSWKNKDDVANGDIGKIVSIDEDEFHDWNVKILWENGNESEYTRSDMENVSLAYCMSIHKSQGSEYKCVIIPMMKEHSSCQIHSRNLLYTGVTRAKKECILVGNQDAIKNAIKKEKINSRTSHFGARLASAAQMSA